MPSKRQIICPDDQWQPRLLKLILRAWLGRKMANWNAGDLERSLVELELLWEGEWKDSFRTGKSIPTCKRRNACLS